MAANSGHLRLALGMVTVVTHALRVVLPVRVRAFVDPTPFALDCAGRRLRRLLDRLLGSLEILCISHVLLGRGNFCLFLC